ncbi:MAG: DNA primase [Kineosporiaceae bacterium]|nr:DNA primase [Kineosporiaceae bacterium]
MKIRREDVEHVRERSRIEDVVAEHVTLRAAGVGSMKGLCPFHDEKTPSFHVRPQVGMWHCFGCGEGGDVIDFVQKVDHLAFAESVERLAARLGYEVHYEDDDGRASSARREGAGQRQRLVEAHRVAMQYYAEQLATSPDALAGRTFLIERGFDRSAAEQFGIGFAPRSGEALLRHLRGRSFTEEELVASGLAGRGQRGLYDRFRGRLLWPIRDVAGDVVGFGARRLFDDDRIEAKYLNTPETPIYKKSHVLYGVDLAKKAIARDRQVVVVEGYTDVMACHLAGVGGAVATCGTAFGEDHLRIVRRLLGDEAGKGSIDLISKTFSRSVVFVFDGDEAGLKAAQRAFGGDQNFAALTYIAVAPDGMDPCELRQAHGDEAVAALVAARRPLFEFAIRATLEHLDLSTAEGRIQGLRAAAPVVARIRDASLRPEYARQLAGWLGMDVEQVTRAVRRGSGSGPGSGSRDRPGRGGARRGPDPRDPVAMAERGALECMLQVPNLVPEDIADGLGENAFEVPAYRAVHHAVRSAGGIATAKTLSVHAWLDRVREEAPSVIHNLITEMAVSPVPSDGEERLARYAADLVIRVAEVDISRVISNLRSQVQRMTEDDPAHAEAYLELLAAESRRRALRDLRTGGS